MMIPKAWGIAERGQLYLHLQGGQGGIPAVHVPAMTDAKYKDEQARDMAPVLFKKY